jgi:hypothetical protein
VTEYRWPVQTPFFPHLLFGLGLFNLAKPPHDKIVYQIKKPLPDLVNRLWLRLFGRIIIDLCGENSYFFWRYLLGMSFDDKCSV